MTDLVHHVELLQIFVRAWVGNEGREGGGIARLFPRLFACRLVHALGFRKFCASFCLERSPEAVLKVFGVFTCLLTMWSLSETDAVSSCFVLDLDLLNEEIRLLDRPKYLIALLKFSKSF